MNFMKCAVFTAPYHFEIREREIPVPKFGEVLVAVKSVGICGSDIHPYQGDGIERRQPGIIMGHEAAGTVSAVGAGVTRWKPGDRVAVNPQISCGGCEMCRQGYYNLCDNMLLIGSSMRRFLDGAMCGYITMGQAQLYALPDSVNFDCGTLLDPLGNAIHLVNRAGVRLGDTVAVIGMGTIGLLAVQTAKLAGAAFVIALDRKERKLQIAKEVGADAVLSMSEPLVADRLKELTQGRGADIVVESAGVGATYNLAMQTVKKRGTVIGLGFAQPEINFSLQPFVYNEINFLGSTGYASECETTLALLAAGKVKTDRIITHTFPLEEVNEAFQTLCNQGSDAIKVILHPSES
jgi:2-desacetyl-2-hydroxyethyl bacteriochlorophyllide A dehydrogenase